MTASPLTALKDPQVPSATDLAYRSLHQAIVSLSLPPGSKLSEIDVANQLGVSRQPVRDAFFRLREQGFLLIRPQRATLVTKISQQAVEQAAFTRTALELACLRAALETVQDPDLAELDQLLDQQRGLVAEGDYDRFYAEDDHFHRRICEISGHGYAWPLIRDQKSHMDRLRRLSLPANGPRAFQDHVTLVQALRDRDLSIAEATLTDHLSRILRMLDTIRGNNPDYFEDTTK